MPTSLSKTIRMIKSSEDLIITPSLHLWLQRNNGVQVSEEIGERIKNLITETPEDRSGAFHPSGLGGCHRAQVFGYLDAPSIPHGDSTLQNLFNDGTWRHLRWQATLLEAGMLTDIEVRIRNRKSRLVGSLDGTHDGHAYGFELKGTRNLASIFANGIMEPHKIQIGTYFLARKDLERFVVIYEDKQTQDWKEIVVSRHDEEIRWYMKYALRELRELNGYVDQRRLPDVLDECKSGKGKTFRSCSFSDFCLGADFPDGTRYERTEP